MEFDPLKHYQGSPCKYGHVGIRYRANYTCVECAKGHAKAFYDNNREQCIQWARRWQSNHPEQSKRIKRDSIARNPLPGRKRAKRWRMANSDRHKAHILVGQAKRRAQKMRAVPVWADHSLIRSIYDKAREMGGEVDHVVPIASRVVCGLHCWENLQILPKGDNSTKSNVVWPDMPEKEVERDTEAERARQHDPSPPRRGAR